MMLASAVKSILRRKWTVAALVLGLLVAGAATFWVVRSNYAVESYIVKRGNIVEAVYGLGTVTANQSYQVKLGVTATITALHVTEGDAVAQGRSLVTIDQEAQFRAPFSGVVTAAPFKQGETVFAQTPVLTLINLKDRYIVVSLEQESALRVRPGQLARISFETLRGEAHRGTVRSLYPDPANSQFFVRIDTPNLPDSILPGMTGDVAIEIAQHSNALLVPVSAVQSGRVLVKNGHLRKKVPIEIGAVDGRWAEVTGGGLREGDEVILSRR